MPSPPRVQIPGTVATHCQGWRIRDKAGARHTFGNHASCRKTVNHPHRQRREECGHPLLAAELVHREQLGDKAKVKKAKWNRDRHLLRHLLRRRLVGLDGLLKSTGPPFQRRKRQVLDHISEEKCLHRHARAPEAPRRGSAPVPQRPDGRASTSREVSSCRAARETAHAPRGAPPRSACHAGARR